MRAVLALTIAIVAIGGAVAQPPEAAPMPAWQPETVEAFSQLPVQERGRVKPLNTYARFALLQISGRKALTIDEVRHQPIAWLMETLFYPENATGRPIFLVESGEVMEAMGLPHEKPRDRYAYNVLAPGRAELFRLANEVGHLDAAQRTPVQSQILQLAQNIAEFERLAVFFGFARHRYEVPEALHGILGAERVGLSAIVANGPAVMGELVRLRQSSSLDDQAKATAVLDLLRQVEQHTVNSDALALIPPAEGSDAEWTTPAELFVAALQGDRVSPGQIEVLRSLEALEAGKGDAAFVQAADALLHDVVALAAATGHYEKIPLEVAYYQAEFMGLNLFFSLTLVLYVLAFLVTALAWLKPRSVALTWVGCAALSVPLLIHCAGIAIRCVIRSRPPVTTLYETILFITAVIVFLAIVVEYMHRRKAAVSLGAFLGAFGIFLANRYEIMEGTDTMPVLIAVLDTNFWLWTHVTTVTIGYGAGLLAGFVAHIYVLGKTFGIKRHNRDFYLNLSRTTYGIICFGLVFSTLGTVLGGIWANDSWGRFWGWDPKENGALMIVLWELAILHAFAGGLIKRYGLNMAAIAGNIIVAFSWFGVNLLGVGLHSYGFTSGVQRVLVLFYGFQSLVLLIGAVGWFRDRADKEARRNSGGTPDRLRPAASDDPGA